MTFHPDDARPYADGFDRSPTEIAALFLADNPDGDPAAFLRQALHLDPDDAAAALDLLDPPWTPTDTTVDLEARAVALGIKIDARWGAKRLADEIVKAESAERDMLIAQARDVFPADQLEAVDIMSTADIAAALAEVG